MQQLNAIQVIQHCQYWHIETCIFDKPRPSEDYGYLPLKWRTLNQMSIEKGLVLKDSQTTAVVLYTLSGSEDSKSDMPMLMENTPLNFINLLAKHGQVNLTVDHTYIHEMMELTRGQSANFMWQYQRKDWLTAFDFRSTFHYIGIT